MVVAAAPMCIYFHLIFVCQRFQLRSEEKNMAYLTCARATTTMSWWRGVRRGKEKSKQNNRAVRSMALHIFHIFIVRFWRMNSYTFQ